MSEKDFELIARVLRETPGQEFNRLSVASRFADTLATTNPRFDRERFIEACS